MVGEQRHDVLHLISYVVVLEPELVRDCLRRIEDALPEIHGTRCSRCGVNPETTGTTAPIALPTVFMVVVVAVVVANINKIDQSNSNSALPKSVAK